MDPLGERTWISRTGYWPVQSQLGPAQQEVKAELKVTLTVGSDAAELPIKSENFSSSEKLLKTTGYVYQWRHRGEPHIDCLEKSKNLMDKTDAKVSNRCRDQPGHID
jgi:hypothetical protein